MSEINFTSQQQDAVNARGHILVSAAAGSGKTAVLVERVISRIVDEQEKTPADRFLIVTFTNDAAAEMKGRITGRLSEFIARNPSNEWLARQSFLLTRAKIGTIDSFCINLVKEYFYKLNIEPDFKLLDAAGEKDLSRTALSLVINDYLREKDENFASLYRLFGTDNALEQLSSVVLDIHSHLVTLPFYERYIDDYEKMYTDFDFESSIWTKTVLSAVNSKFSALYDEFLSVKNAFEESDISEKYHERFYDRLNGVLRIKTAAENGSWQEVRRALNSYDKKTLSRVATDDKLFLQRIQELCRRADGFVKNETVIFSTDKDEYINDINTLTPSIKALFDTVRKFDERLLILKQNAKTYSFSDIEIMALKILVNPDGTATDIADELSEYYCEVMVDEFQDTNGLQCAIFNALSQGGSRLFAVGDVKQSIYGFRKANPKIFLSLKNSLPLYNRKSGERQNCKVIMSGNFRSERNICEFINFLFYNIMSERVGQMDYTDEDRLQADYSIDNGGKANVRLEIIDGSANTEACKGAQYRQVANIIKDTVANGLVGKEGARRPAKYSDIAVLFRTAAQCAAMAAELKKSGIPYISRKESDFFESREIKCAAALLSVIDNPKNEFELFSLLSGELFGFTSEDIARLKIRDKSADLYTLMLKYPDTCDKVPQFLEKLNRYRMAAVQTGLKELLLYVFDDTGLFNISRSQGGARSQANLYKMISIASDFDGNSSSGLSGFINYFRRIRELGGVDAGKTDGGEDAVRIMTIHNSKGLQFPVCIVGGLERSYNSGGNNDVRSLHTENCGIGLKIIDNEHLLKYKTLPYFAAESELFVSNLSEEIRLLYVALTRAAEQLIMIGQYSNKGGAAEFIRKQNANLIGGKIPVSAAQTAKSSLELITLSALLHPDCGNLLDIANGKEAEYTIQNKCFAANVIMAEDITALDAQTCDTAPQFDEAAVDELTDRLSYTYPYEIINSVAAKQSASRIAHDAENADRSCSAVPLFMQGQKLTPAQKGTAMHKLMQYIDLESAARDLGAEFERIRDKNLLTAAELECIDAEKVKAFVSSPLCKRMMNADSIYREREFMAELSANELDNTLPPEFADEKVVVQGAVDCVFFEGGKMCIVDYKTDRVTDGGELVSKYAVQLKVYEKALCSIFEPQSTELVIYSFALSREIPL